MDDGETMSDTEIVSEHSNKSESETKVGLTPKILFDAPHTAVMPDKTQQKGEKKAKEGREGGKIQRQILQVERRDREGRHRVSTGAERERRPHHRAGDRIG